MFLFPLRKLAHKGLIRCLMKAPLDNQHWGKLLYTNNFSCIIQIQWIYFALSCSSDHYKILQMSQQDSCHHKYNNNFSTICIWAIYTSIWFEFFMKTASPSRQSIENTFYIVIELYFFLVPDFLTSRPLAILVPVQLRTNIKLMALMNGYICMISMA